jgi:hypothetical protein
MPAWTVRPRDRILQIRGLYRKDEEFRELWDDYLAARKARRYFERQRNSQRVEEYLELGEELAEEVRKYIDSRR